MCNLFNIVQNLCEKFGNNHNSRFSKQSNDVPLEACRGSEAGHRNKHETIEQLTNSFPMPASCKEKNKHNHLIVFHGLKEVCPKKQMEELRLKLQVIILLKQITAIQKYYNPSVFEIPIIPGIEFPQIFQQYIIKKRQKTKPVITIRDITEYEILKTEEKDWAMLIPDDEDGLEPCWCPYFVKTVTPSINSIQTYHNVIR